MNTQNIPAEQWVGFAKDFSREHLGELVTIEVQDEGRGPIPISERLPLMGISFDTAGTRPSSIEIAVGDESRGLTRHVVDLPMTIQICMDRERTIELQVEPANGPLTRLLLQREVH